MADQPAPPPADRHTQSIIAYALVAAFVANTFAPYWFSVGDGRTGDLVVSGAKTLETVLVFVLGYYYGTNKDSTRKTDALIQNQRTHDGGNGQPGQGAQVVVERADRVSGGDPTVVSRADVIDDTPGPIAGRADDPDDFPDEPPAIDTDGLGKEVQPRG